MRNASFMTIAKKRINDFIMMKEQISFQNEKCFLYDNRKEAAQWLHHDENHELWTKWEMLHLWQSQTISSMTKSSWKTQTLRKICSGSFMIIVNIRLNYFIMLKDKNSKLEIFLYDNRNIRLNDTSWEKTQTLFLWKMVSLGQS